MGFFKKRTGALLLTAIMVLVSTGVSVNVKLGNKIQAVNESFYEGLYSQGYPQKGIGAHLDNICTYADGLITIANNYDIDTEELEYDTEDLKMGRTYSPYSASYLYYCYDELCGQIDALERLLAARELSERDAEGVEKYLTNINGAKSAIASSSYNEEVRDFLRRYDRFPTDLMAELANLDMPEYFVYS